ncbi:putative G-protein coupled receptor 157 [Escovopsis weberi]|uniref:Putative G-protein coupled receptor 157 n=1 Tax=Escovopsis weberi TaxID=150374 RepID=A0A0M9VWD9_ESCWE|nr:putative G-protein coupled receptor 157 [Escovopsis weberi]
MDTGDLPLEGQTLRPLPPGLQHGLLAVFVLSAISFISAGCLFIYLSYKLMLWYFTVKRPQDREIERRHRNLMQQRDAAPAKDTSTLQPNPGLDDLNLSPQHKRDFALGIEGLFGKEASPFADSACPDDGAVTDDGTTKRTTCPVAAPRPPTPLKPARTAPNQFLILIYNLLLADLHQSLAFLFNGQWLHSNGVIVGTPICFTQGLFVSLGDLSSSMFILLIAVHTYLSVVRGIQAPQRVLYYAIVSVWFFVYFISFLPLAITKNGASSGGFFVRAVAWCWISKSYEPIRLLTHYLWIFIALVSTSALYIAIWLHLRGQARRNLGQKGYNPAFLIYPLIYIMCTLPLALGRLLTMVGVELPVGYFCFAGAMISFNGFFDCVLFGTTRHIIIFGSKFHLDDQDTGVKTIAFLQTPQSRVYGNMVWVQGGSINPSQEPPSMGGWWSWKRIKSGKKKIFDEEQGAARRAAGGAKRHKAGTSQESLRGIQMDMVTSVVVEVDDGKGSQVHPHHQHNSYGASRATSVRSPNLSLEYADARPQT